jgi:hypothetical protein
MNTVKSEQHIINQDNKRKINKVIIGLLLLGYSLLSILPWNPTGYGFDLDQSWSSALHIAFANKIQFGQDLIYTYGPYGFLQVNLYFPETYSYLFTFRLLIAIAAWIGLFRLVSYCLARRDQSVFWLIPILGCFPNQFLGIDSFFFLILILPLVLYFYVSKQMSPALILTIVIVALASLTKHTYLMVSLVFIALITIDELGKLRRIPQVLPVYLAFICLFWLIAGQDLVNLPAYVVNGLEIVKGFSASMGIPGNLDEVLLYMFSTGIFLILVGAIEARYRGWWGLLPTLGLAAIMFISFKGAFTRHDAHALQALFNIAPVISIFTALLCPNISKTSWRINKTKLSAILGWGMGSLLFAIMGLIILNHYLDFGYGNYTLNLITHTNKNLVDATKLLRGKADLQASVDQAKANIREANPLPPISGTVDLYPNEIATIFAHDLDYQPRPIMQSFSAYTSKLAHLNVEHLKQPDAAKTILFDLNPIDERLASFEDGLSWPEILTLYNITNIDGRYLTLQRVLKPRKYKLKSITKQQKLSFGEWFDMPTTSEAIWSQINIDPNILGKLATNVLRLPSLYMEIETADGSQTKYRTIGDVMGEGFLLSPLLSTRWDFLNLAAPNWHEKLAQKQVTKFRIVSEGFNSWLYPQTYKFELSQLKFPRQSFAQVPGWSDWDRQIIPVPLNGKLERIELDSNHHTGWMAHSPMKMLINLKRQQHTFAFSFGISEEGVEEAIIAKQGDGVEFKIVAIQPNGEKQILFYRKLQPRKNIKDRGIQQATIDLREINTTKLFLETIPGENDQYDWSYWAKLIAD